MTANHAADPGRAKLVLAVLDAIEARDWTGSIIGDSVYVSGLEKPLRDFAEDFEAAISELTALLELPKKPLPKPRFFVTPSYPQPARYAWELDITERSG